MKYEMNLSPLQYTIECHPHSEQPEKKCLDGISRFSPHTSVYLTIGAFLVAVVVEGEPELWVVDPHTHPDPVPVIKEVYDYLINIFGIEFVHREFFFTDDRRTRTDFFIYCKNGDFSVDVFYPSDKHNFIGCLNSKMHTYASETMLQYPVIFLQMNNDINQEEIENILKRKKNKLLKYQSVMNLKEFKKFCSQKTPLEKT